MYIVLFPKPVVPRTLNISFSTSSVNPSFLANNIGAFLAFANGAAANPSTIASCPTNTTAPACPSSNPALLTSIAVANLSSPANELIVMSALFSNTALNSFIVLNSPATVIVFLFTVISNLVNPSTSALNPGSSGN